MNDHSKSPEINYLDAGELNFSQAQKLQEMIMGFRTTQIISTATRLNLPTHLQDSPKTSLQLASITETDTNAISRLMTALANLNIVEKNVDDTYSLTSLGNLLTDRSQGSLRHVAILYGEPWLWSAYAELPKSLASGKPAFEYAHGHSLYDYLRQNEAAAQVFDKAMSAFSQYEAEAIKKVYLFSEAKMVVDVGGGQGSLALALLDNNPHLHVIVFDQPSVIDNLNKKNEDSKKDQRITFASGDFFRDVPEGGDIYLLKSILHNWDDQSCMTILRNCRKAMTGNGRLLILERVIPDGNEQSEGKLFDINMLVMTNGRERSVKEYEKLLDASGFILKRITPTSSSISIVEAFRKSDALS